MMSARVREFREAARASARRGRGIMRERFSESAFVRGQLAIYLAALAGGAA